MKSCYSTIKTFNVSQELTSITVPTCIIQGSESFIPLSQAKYFEKKIRNTYLAIIEGAGHSTPRETPKKVNEVIEKFIQM